ncbi:MAG: T9SS type A sorting domain-containing protein, partial [Ignavibacteria bacterium]|nr:T9SS type A sorting domain-containing protein [Ignavibacteria bacterium]
MQKIFRTIILAVVLCTTIYSQLDSVIFVKWGAFNDTPFCFCDDQNGDGYNDIMIKDFDNGIGKVRIYPGGPLIDTIPFWEVKRDFSAVAIDINGDGHRDIVTFPYDGAGKLAVYYGGPLLDTIPDYYIQFPVPSTATGIIIDPAGTKIDMNGDGIEELVFWYGQYPNDTLYLYETGSKFTGEPRAKIAGEYFRHKIWRVQFGDLNGDGCSDLWIEFHDPVWPNPNTRFDVIYGEPEWDLSARFSYQADITGYIGDGLSFSSSIISDFNGDGKDDWLHSNKGQYPYFYGRMVSSGGYPPTQYPTAYRGLNTQDRGPLGGFKMDVGDVNGDGLQDLMLSVGYDEQWLWLGGRPALDDVANKKYFGAKGRGHVGDITGDGVDDLALVFNSAPGSTGYRYAVIIAGDRNLVSVKDGEKPQNPNTLRLFAYPNPFNPSTKISYTVPSPGEVTLSIYNVSGELVEQRILGERSAGSYEEELNLGKTGASSGVYFAEITF